MDLTQPSEGRNNYIQPPISHHNLNNPQLYNRNFDFDPFGLKPNITTLATSPIMRRDDIRAAHGIAVNINTIGSMYPPAPHPPPQRQSSRQHHVFPYDQSCSHQLPAELISSALTTALTSNHDQHSHIKGYVHRNSNLVVSNSSSRPTSPPPPSTYRENTAPPFPTYASYSNSETSSPTGFNNPTPASSSRRKSSSRAYSPVYQHTSPIPLRKTTSLGTHLRLSDGGGETELESHSPYIVETFRSPSEENCKDFSKDEEATHEDIEEDYEEIQDDHQGGHRETRAGEIQENQGTLQKQQDIQHSSPEPSPNPEPIPKSIPIKERLTPKSAPVRPKHATKRTFETITTSPHSTSKSKRVKCNEISDPEPRVSPELKRQLQAAVTIISLETAGKDIQLFGEVVETEEERKKKLEKLKAEIETARQAREVKKKRIALKKEAKELREWEKQRKAAEETERMKWEKEVEEAKKKAIRDKQRKKAEIANQKELEYKRQLALQKIETDRLKSEMQSLQKENDRREAEEKANGVQVEPDILARLKAKYELAKKQAAGLSGLKITDPPKEDINSLFVPEGLLGGSCSKLTSATNATSIFANAKPISSISSYREVREATTAKKEHERLEEVRKKQDARLKAKVEKDAQEAIKAAEKRELVKKVAELKTAKMSKINKSVRNPFPDSDEEEDPGDLIVEWPQDLGPPAHTTASSPELNLQSSVSQTYSSSADRNGSSGNTETVSTIPSGEPTKGKKGRTEEQRLALRRKNDEKARERKKIRLISDAEAKGIDLSQGNLERQLDAFMDKREKEKERRERQRQKKGVFVRETSGSNQLTLEALTSYPSFGSTTDNSASNIDADEVVALTASQERRKQSSLARGSRFSQSATQVQTVADLGDDSSDESEEDPDEFPDEPAPFDVEGDLMDLDEAINAAIGEAENDSHEDGGEDGAMIEIALTQNHHQPFPQPNNTISTTSAPSMNQIHVYMVYENKTENGEKQEPSILEKFVSRGQANACAKEKMRRYRDRYKDSFPAFKDSYDQFQLYSAELWIEPSYQNGIFITVIRNLQSTEELSNFDALAVQRLLPAKSYLLRQITTKTIPGNDGNSTIIEKDSSIIPNFHYSNHIDANFNACIHAINLLKPKTPNINYLERHANHISPEIRAARDQFTNDGVALDMEIGVDENLPWMAPITHIHLRIELFEMQGPFN